MQQTQIYICFIRIICLFYFLSDNDKLINNHRSQKTETNKNDTNEISNETGNCFH